MNSDELLEIFGTCTLSEAKLSILGPQTHLHSDTKLWRQKVENSVRDMKY